MKEQMICANCGKKIPQGEGRWITLERYTPYERTWQVCSRECYEGLKEICCDPC